MEKNGNIREVKFPVYVKREREFLLSDQVSSVLFVYTVHYFYS